VQERDGNTTQWDAGEQPADRQKHQNI